ncbi:MAG: glutathione transporter ATP-binding protein [Devosia sp.]|jgi:peptide/nickel transport system ATP-binding protein/glutathione transport system ATP-binding protein|nr:glutathione transporter ATP-binding protein [Devosia sp.]
MSNTAILDVDSLKVVFETDNGPVVAVDGLSFEIRSGECVAVVGESGSGKSVTAMSILGLGKFSGGRIAEGAIRFRRKDARVVDLAAADEGVLRGIRGNEIAMVFQEPMTSLNPVFTVGEQIAEVIRLHQKADAADAARQAVELLKRVRIPEPERRFTQYPHELSGGMRQRVVIAIALACSPRLLIADEPTTALDVTIQAQILELVRSLAAEGDMAVLFITHDMGVVAEMADRVVVMRHGRKVEEATTRELFARPREAYTQQLLAAVPRLGSMQGASRPAKFGEALMHDAPPTHRPLLEVKHLITRFPVKKGVLQRHVANVHAVDDVSFSIGSGETLALVGESGCGKSTTGRSLLRLVEPKSGSVTLEGDELTRLSGDALRKKRRDMQIIFQDPYAALDPRLTAFEQVAEPLVIHGVEAGSALRDRVVGLIRRVGLSDEQLERYPHEFSGGQRQRLCIARALTLSPKLIVADEPVSALDVSIQAQVVNLMIELQQELGLSYLFISHDMAVVERVSHRVAVMHMGRIVEMGPRNAVFGDPRHPYTRTLLAAVPNPDPTASRRPVPPAGLLPSPIYPVGHDPAPPRYDEVGANHFVLAA